jgi:FtsP/CotA-like multicopper oxidase with cupredoxin domain
MNRRDFLHGVLSGVAVGGRPLPPADCTLRIGMISQDVAPGFVYRTSAYNGNAPAPVIRLREGVPITVDIFNDTLCDEYVHWHGFDVAPAMDGTAEEGSGPVPASGHLRYAFTPRQAGVRWVHSHAMSHSTLDRGVYGGQYGIVYVEPRHSPGNYDREYFLAAHEWGAELRWIRDAGQEEEEEDAAGPMRMSPAGGSWEVQYDIGSINGKALGHGEPLRVREGERVLFHILNASATVMQRFALAGHRFEIIALDGNPVPKPRLLGVLELGAGERVSAIVEMGNPGVWILGAVPDSEREDGRMGVVVEYAGRSGAPQWLEPAFQPWDYAMFAETRPQPEISPERVLPVVIARGLADDNGMETWTINGSAYDRNPQTIRAGLRCRLVLENRSDEDHPVHLHRNSFELTRVQGRAVSGVWKDVVVLKRYERLEVDFTPSQEGLCLFHCHQQMHMDAGFKKLFAVVVEA